MSSTLHAIYDFEFFPYALGDVLTWNIQSALLCEKADLPKVDVYICMDRRRPASIYQRGLINADNCALHLNELLAAFSTHPYLGNLHVFADQDEMIERLRATAPQNAASREYFEDYVSVLDQRDNSDALNAYFIKYIYSHDKINAFAATHGRIPLLAPSRGHEADVEGFIQKAMAGQRIVLIHPRLRRLDNGLGGEHTYFRDSDFLEWYEFARDAGRRFPDVQFVVLGRLQEKPLELLRLPNVTSFRPLGLGLGHELALMTRADLFIGTSSGFAAMANFTTIPYFITKMNAESCNAYKIGAGDTRLPFARANQVLVYEAETSALLMSLLERGLAAAPLRTEATGPSRSDRIDASAFSEERTALTHPSASTSRFFIDDTAADQEAAFLLAPRIKQAVGLWAAGNKEQAALVASRIRARFPRLSNKFTEFIELEAELRKAEPGLPLVVSERVQDVSRRIEAALRRAARPVVRPLRRLANRPALRPLRRLARLLLGRAA